MQSYLLAKALDAIDGWDAVDISVEDCYIQQPYTIGLWEFNEQGDNKEGMCAADVHEIIDSADVFVIHNFDPRYEDLGPHGDKWRPTYELTIPGYKVLKIPLRRDNCVIKLHGTDTRVYAGFIHGYEYRHGHTFVGSPDPQLWGNAKCVQWIPPMMDRGEMQTALDEWKGLKREELEGYAKLIGEKKPIVVNHCATQRKTKHTEVLTEAMGLLRERGVKAYADIVQGVTWAESLWHQSVCDVYFDQVGYYGYPGISAIQALLLGKPVIVELSPLVKSWLAGFEGLVEGTGGPPFIDINGVEGVANAIEHYNYAEWAPERRREWAERVHGLSTVGEQWRWLIEGVSRR
jgi:hypothetical protein